MKRTTEAKSSDNGKKFPVKVVAAAVAVLVLIIVLMVVEAAGSRKYTIINKTDTPIESIILYMENEDEDYYFRSENIAEVSVGAGEKESGSFKELEDYLNGASLMIKVKFEGREEVLMYSGYFRNGFDGKIKLVFKEDKKNPGNITVDIKAGTGLFQSTNFTDCDETQDLFLDE